MKQLWIEAVCTQLFLEAIDRKKNWYQNTCFFYWYLKCFSIFFSYRISKGSGGALYKWPELQGSNNAIHKMYGEILSDLPQENNAILWVPVSYFMTRDSLVDIIWSKVRNLNCRVFNETFLGLKKPKRCKWFLYILGRFEHSWRRLRDVYFQEAIGASLSARISFTAIILQGILIQSPFFIKATELMKIWSFHFWVPSKNNFPKT